MLLWLQTNASKTNDEFYTTTGVEIEAYESNLKWYLAQGDLEVRAAFEKLG